MFALNEGDRDKTIADVASGASSFCAEWRQQNQSRCIAIDPVYGLGALELENRVRRGVATAIRNIEVAPQDYRWDSAFKSVSDHQQERTSAALRFLADIRESRYYIAAQIEHLPLMDDSVDLVLSSHLLFTYAGSLSIDFHVKSLTEMVRIARSEVRIFPVVGFEYNADATVAAVMEWSRRIEGLSISIVPVEYEFLRGADKMMVISKTARSENSNSDSLFTLTEG